MKDGKSVTVKNTTFESAPYVTTLHNKLIGKVISDPRCSAKKLAVLDNIEDVVADAEYVGSGVSSKAPRDVIRYDYFESSVNNNGKDCIAAIDIEARGETNRARTYRIET